MAWCHIGIAWTSDDWINWRIYGHQPVNIFWHINLVGDPHNGLDNGLLPICHQAIILTNAVLLSENKPLPEPMMT